MLDKILYFQINKLINKALKFLINSTCDRINYLFAISVLRNKFSIIQSRLAFAAGRETKNVEKRRRE